MIPPQHAKTARAEDYGDRVIGGSEGAYRGFVRLPADFHLSDRELYAHLWTESLREETKAMPMVAGSA